MADLDPKGEGDNSMVRHEALCHIPHSVGRNLEGRSWVQCLTLIRKEIRGQQHGSKSVVVSRRMERRTEGPARYGEQLDCLNPSLQKMQWFIRRKDA